MLAFSDKVCYYTEALRKRKQNPGVAKFGIALEWGSRGLEFESRHSDQKSRTTLVVLDFYFLLMNGKIDSRASVEIDYIHSIPIDKNTVA